MNRTDLRCLSVLSQAGTLSAGALAHAAGLTRGAMTTALDRLETAGFVRRVWDQQDRRTLRAEGTDAAKQAVEVLFGPLAKDQLLQTYTGEELAAVLKYLDDAGSSSVRTRSAFASSVTPAPKRPGSRAGDEPRGQHSGVDAGHEIMEPRRSRRLS